MSNYFDFSKDRENEMKALDTYPSNIKLYSKLAIIGRGAFGSVSLLN